MNISSIIRGFRFSKDDVHLVVLPLGHTASINYSFLPCTILGATLVLTGHFGKLDPSFWDLIKLYEATYVEIVQLIWWLWIIPHIQRSYSDIMSLKFIGCGSATLPLETQIKFIEKYRIKVANLAGYQKQVRLILIILWMTIGYFSVLVTLWMLMS